jgi:hypothetical protein
MDRLLERRRKLCRRHHPPGVTGADNWSYDAAAKVVIADKVGSTFSIAIAGLTGYP